MNIQGILQQPLMAFAGLFYQSWSGLIAHFCKCCSGWSTDKLRQYLAAFNGYCWPFLALFSTYLQYFHASGRRLRTSPGLVSLMMAGTKHSSLFATASGTKGKYSVTSITSVLTKLFLSVMLWTNIQNSSPAILFTLVWCFRVRPKLSRWSKQEWGPTLLKMRLVQISCRHKTLAYLSEHQGQKENVMWH